MRHFAVQEDEKRIILALSPPKTYQENTLRMIIDIQKESSMHIIVICVNRPVVYLMDLYGRNGIDLSRIFFIDAITRYATGTEMENTENSIFVSNPGDLTSMGIAVTTTLKQFKGDNNLLFLDSVNAMLIHTSSLNLTKFIHFLISRLRLIATGGILLAVEKGLDPMLLSQITSFADDLVEFPEENTE